MRVETEAIADPEGFRNRMASMGEALDMTWELNRKDRKLRTVIMASKEAHCLSDLLYNVKEGLIPIEVAAVVANHEVLRPLAEFYGVPFVYIPVTKDTKPEAEAALMDVITEHDAELVVLARYMQILSDKVCAAMQGRIINIHHSVPTLIQGRSPVRPGACPWRQAHWRHCPLCHPGPGRGPNHRAGRGAGEALGRRDGYGRTGPGRGTPRTDTGRALARRASCCSTAAPRWCLPKGSRFLGAWVLGHLRSS